MHELIQDAIRYLHASAEHHSQDERDNLLISAMISVINSHEVPFGLLMSLCMTCVLSQQDVPAAALQFTEAFLRNFNDYQAKIEEALQESQSEVMH
jgi:hypothetical protein